MNANLKLEPVATPAEAVREAIRRRDDLSRQLDAMKGKLNTLKPLEAELQAAQTELQAIIDEDSETLRAWLKSGSGDDMPEPRLDARQAAARRVSGCMAKLASGDGARAKVDVEIADLNARYRDALAGVRRTEFDVMLHELERAAHAWRNAAVDYVVAEAIYTSARDALFQMAPTDAGPASHHAATIVQPINCERELADRARQLAADRFTKLLVGEQPSPDLLKVTIGHV
ncbi:MAG: hypothetical protein ACTHNM_06825 [Dyella sp.]|uniref:hypothetical protein n=1 Tax=Dyella sp. TaxID=1869338 RepID=UPI003F818646